MRISTIYVGLLLALVSCGQTVLPQGAGSTTAAIEAQGLSQKHGALGKYFQVKADGTEALDHLQIDSNLSNSFGANPLNRKTHVNWNAQISSPTEEKYTFYIKTNGKATITINSTVYTTDADGNLTLETFLGGPDQINDIAVDYRYDGSGPSKITFEWQSATQPRQEIPKKYLSPKDLTADCERQPAQGCLPKFNVPFGYGSFFREGTQQTINYQIDNLSDIYPLHLKIYSDIFANVAGEFTIAPSESGLIPLTFGCPQDLGTGTIYVTRLEDGVTQASPLQIGCFGEGVGPQ